MIYFFITRFDFSKFNLGPFVALMRIIISSLEKIIPTTEEGDTPSSITVLFDNLKYEFEKLNEYITSREDKSTSEEKRSLEKTRDNWVGQFRRELLACTKNPDEAIKVPALSIHSEFKKYDIDNRVEKKGDKIQTDMTFRFNQRMLEEPYATQLSESSVWDTYGKWMQAENSCNEFMADVASKQMSKDETGSKLRSNVENAFKKGLCAYLDASNWLDEPLTETMVSTINQLLVDAVAVANAQKTRAKNLADASTEKEQSQETE